MAFALDTEIAATLAGLAAAARPEQPAPGDPLALREFIDPGLELSFGRLPDWPDVETVDHAAPSAEGASVPMRWYTKKNSSPGSAVVYVHGGGMICGSVSVYDRLVRHYVGLTGVPFLAVDYRLAPEYADVGLGKDVLAGIKWLHDKASEFGIDPSRIAIMGDSGGGGVGAAAAIQARDAGVALARQILIYPMLDDRNLTPDPQIAATALWTYEHNRTAWTAVLGDRLGGEGVPASVVPSRLTDFAGLAPAYIEVGELDIFRDESIAYASGLYAAGISCELHVHPGAPHSHDWINQNSTLCGRVVEDRIRVIHSI